MAAGERPAPRLPPVTTALLAVVWLAVVAQGWGPLVGGEPADRLGDAPAAAARISERELALAEAIARREGPERLALARLYDAPADARAWGIEVHRELLERDAWLVESEKHAAAARLAVLLLEDGSPEATAEARGWLGDPRVAAVARGDEPGLSDRWIARGQRALSGDGSGTAPSNTAHGERLARRSLAILATNGSLVALGAVLLASGLVRRRSAGPHRPPWPLADGIGVFVRADLWNRLFFLGLAWLSEMPGGARFSASPAGLLLWSWGSLFAHLPLLFLVHRFLLRPHGQRFRDLFAGPTSAPGVGGLLAIALAAIAVDLAGTQAIGWAVWWLGLGSSWAEGIDEVLLWGPAVEVALTSVDYLLWTPVFEELAFRGVLYFTLRRRFAALPAAAGTATFFALLHFYGLPGFAMTLWSGFVWALAFERARSLLPGIAAHAVYNGLFVAGWVLLYR